MGGAVRDRAESVASVAIGRRTHHLQPDRPVPPANLAGRCVDAGRDGNGVLARMGVLGPAAVRAVTAVPAPNAVRLLREPGCEAPFVGDRGTAHFSAELHVLANDQSLKVSLKYFLDVRFPAERIERHACILGPWGWRFASQHDT